MIRRITLIALSLIGIFSLNNAFAQEGGAPDKAEENQPIAVSDSSMVFEDFDTEHLNEPVSTPFNIPLKKVQKNTQQRNTETNQISGLASEGDVEVKDSKQEFSFNIIYYLIYKFKQVDN